MGCGRLAEFVLAQLSGAHDARRATCGIPRQSGQRFEQAFQGPSLAGLVPHWMVQ